jgi:hypothetical protein
MNSKLQNNSSNVKQMYLVDPKEFNSRNTSTTISGSGKYSVPLTLHQNLLQDRIEGLDEEMQAILKNGALRVQEKLQLYLETLRKYIMSARQFDRTLVADRQQARVVDKSLLENSIAPAAPDATFAAVPQSPVAGPSGVKRPGSDINLLSSTVAAVGSPKKQRQDESLNLNESEGEDMFAHLRHYDEPQQQPAAHFNGDTTMTTEAGNTSRSSTLNTSGGLSNDSSASFNSTTDQSVVAGQQQQPKPVVKINRPLKMPSMNLSSVSDEGTIREAEHPYSQYGVYTLMTNYAKPKAVDLMDKILGSKNLTWDKNTGHVFYKGERIGEHPDHSKIDQFLRKRFGTAHKDIKLSGYEDFLKALAEERELAKQAGSGGYRVKRGIAKKFVHPYAAPLLWLRY